MMRKITLFKYLVPVCFLLLSKGFCSDSSLIITELFPAPTEGNSEWFEVYFSGTSPYDISSLTSTNHTKSYPLSEVTQNIFPHTYCIIVQNKVSFIELYGEIRTCIIEPEHWITLSNSGGTLVISDSSNNTLDSIVWTKDDVASNTALIRERTSHIVWKKDYNFATGTPGVEITPTPIINSVTLLSQSISHSSPFIPFSIKVSLHTGDILRWHIFDYAGNHIHSALIDAPGNTKAQWNGMHKGTLVIPGIYFLVYQFNESASNKTPFVVAP